MNRCEEVPSSEWQSSQSADSTQGSNHYTLCVQRINEHGKTTPPVVLTYYMKRILIQG
jgi:hypothetical protein